MGSPQKDTFGSECRVSTGPVWLQRMVKRGGVYGLVTCVAGIVVHPQTAKLVNLGGDAETSSYLMFIGFCLSAFAKPLQQLFHDLMLDDAAPGGSDEEYIDKDGPTPPATGGTSL